MVNCKSTYLLIIDYKFYFLYYLVLIYIFFILNFSILNIPKVYIIKNNVLINVRKINCSHYYLNTANYMKLKINKYTNLKIVFI